MPSASCPNSPADQAFSIASPSARRPKTKLLAKSVRRVPFVSSVATPIAGAAGLGPPYRYSEHHYRTYPRGNALRLAAMAIASIGSAFRCRSFALQFYIFHVWITFSTILKVQFTGWFIQTDAAGRRNSACISYAAVDSAEGLFGKSVLRYLAR